MRCQLVNAGKGNLVNCKANCEKVPGFQLSLSSNTASSCCCHPPGLQSHRSFQLQAPRGLSGGQFVTILIHLLYKFVELGLPSNVYTHSHVGKIINASKSGSITFQLERQTSNLPMTADLSPCCHKCWSSF
jgi:hypothetical protein